MAWGAGRVTRARALVVTPRRPWPRDDGGRIGLWQAVWSVAREYETTLVTLTLPGENDSPPPAEFATLGIEIVRVPHRPPSTPLALVRGAFGRWPYTLVRYRNAQLDATLRRVVVERKPAFAYLNHLHLATYLDALAGVPVMLREHNLEYVWLERYAGTLSNPAARAYARAQSRRMRATEADLCSRCDLVLAIQEREADALRRLAPAARVEVVPIGIDMDVYLPRAPESPPTALLAGSFAWPPNTEGARRFLELGWPRVCARVPGARLRLAGKDLSPGLAENARRAGAEPVGYVESMPVEFARAAAMVVPLWVGAGARIKIVESLAARLPVVTTALGAEGLGLEPGTHALFAETPEALGDAVAELLLEPERARRIAEAGHALASARFALDIVARRTCELCADAIARHAGVARSLVAAKS